MHTTAESPVNLVAVHTTEINTSVKAIAIDMT
jgi:hypothetical protein